MSRGHGTLQRALLTLIRANRYLTTFELTGMVFNIQPDAQNRVVLSDAQLVSVRRALASLAKEGLIVPWHRLRNANRNTCCKSWATPEYAEEETTRVALVFGHN
jgi:hypothetical protein